MATFKAIIDDPPQSILSQVTPPPPIPLRRPRRQATESEKEAIRMKKAANKLAKEKGIIPPGTIAAATAKILASSSVSDPVTSAIEAKTPLVLEPAKTEFVQEELAAVRKSGMTSEIFPTLAEFENGGDSSEEEYTVVQRRPKPKKQIAILEAKLKKMEEELSGNRRSLGRPIRSFGFKV